MPTLYFIRHGESEANVRSAYAGRSPVPLTARGREEAAHTAQQLKEHHLLTKIYTSPLARAQETASYFTKQFQVPATTLDILQEQDMGDYSGLTYATASQLPSFELDISKRWNWSPPNGETYEQVGLRTLQFLELMQQEGEQEHILVVTHGVFLRLMRGALENTFPAFFVGLSKNCEVWKTFFTQTKNAHEVEVLYFGAPDTKAHNE